MKLNDLKHNHSLTDLLKVIIFSILMLMPFLGIATRCLYVVVNKNAYQSYSDRYLTQEVNLTSTSQLVPNQDYIFNYVSYTEDTQYHYIPTIYYNNISIDWSDYTSTDVTSVTGFRFRTNDNLIQLFNNNGGVVDNVFNTWGTTLTTFTINFNRFEFSQTERLYNLSITGLYYQNEKLDNVFEYSIDQVTQSNLFNWTQNTGIYTGINTMTTQLGIVGVFIPMLLTYWFLLTVIYIIIDIVLKTFTVISHMLIKKAE